MGAARASVEQGKGARRQAHARCTAVCTSQRSWLSSRVGKHQVLRWQRPVCASTCAGAYRMEATRCSVSILMSTNTYLRYRRWYPGHIRVRADVQAGRGRGQGRAQPGPLRRGAAAPGPLLRAPQAAGVAGSHARDGCDVDGHQAAVAVVHKEVGALAGREAARGVSSSRHGAVGGLAAVPRQLCPQRRLLSAGAARAAAVGGARKQRTSAAAEKSSTQQAPKVTSPMMNVCSTPAKLQ